MRVCQVFTLFLVLWDGRPDLTRAETYSAAEGENLPVKLLFYSSGDWKIFCKNDCNKTEDILVQTSENRQKNGRYSIEYKDSSNPRTMSVSITDVSRSDSGRYSCGLENWSGAEQTDKDYREFMIKVTKAFTPTPDLTTQQSVVSAQTSRPSSSKLSSLLWLLLIPVVMVIPSGLLLLSCKKKKSQNDQETTGNSRGSRKEFELYENCGPAAVSEPVDSTYQSLSLATMDPNQTYSTIRAQP